MGRWVLLLLLLVACFGPEKSELKLMIGSTTEEAFAQYGAPDNDAFIENGSIVATWIYGSKRLCRVSLWFSDEGRVIAWQRQEHGWFWCPWR